MIKKKIVINIDENRSIKQLRVKKTVWRQVKILASILDKSLGDTIEVILNHYNSSKKE